MYAIALYMKIYHPVIGANNVLTVSPYRGPSTLYIPTVHNLNYIFTIQSGNLCTFLPYFFVFNS